MGSRGVSEEVWGGEERLERLRRKRKARWDKGRVDGWR